MYTTVLRLTSQNLKFQNHPRLKLRLTQKEMTKMRMAHPDPELPPGSPLGLYNPELVKLDEEVTLDNFDASIGVLEKILKKTLRSEVPNWNEVTGSYIIVCSTYQYFFIYLNQGNEI